MRKRNVFGMISTIKDVTKNITQFKLYPNPTQGKFSINNNDKINSITVYDVFGKTVVNIPDFKNLLSNEIDLKQFGKGVYFLRINSAGKVFSEKVIIE